MKIHMKHGYNILKRFIKKRLHQNRLRASYPQPILREVCQSIRKPHVADRTVDKNQEP